MNVKEARDIVFPPEHVVEFDMNEVIMQNLDSAQMQRVMDAIKLLMAYRILKPVRVRK